MRIPFLETPQQLMLRYIQEMNFTARAQFFRSRSIVFAFDSCPKPEIQDDINAENERTSRNAPKHGFDDAVTVVMFRTLRIIAKEPLVPFISR